MTSQAARYRVISDNDYAGDPDGLVQLAHHLLSPSVDVRTVIGSHLTPFPGMEPSRGAPELAVAKAQQVVDLVGSDASVVAGAAGPLVDARTPAESPAADAIVEEAMRDDDRPLFVCCGGSLTALASAWLMEPRIADRLTAVWIGGEEYPGLGGEPIDEPEFNLTLDPVAVPVVLEDSPIEVWQVPRDAYRQVIASMTELEEQLGGSGPLGAHLYAELESANAEIAGLGINTGECFVLGDSPLVLLTALQTGFAAGPASSRSVGLRPDLRVFTHLDSALLIRDLYAKVRRHDGGGDRS